MPDPGERQTIWRHMRVPALAAAALLGFLTCIVLLGQLAPSPAASAIEAVLTLCMIATVLLFSMEVRLESSLTRFYAALGFCWLAVLVAMTMLDYLTR